jgi:uncharacterized repeat protein (TIGR01451 family)
MSRSMLFVCAALAASLLSTQAAQGAVASADLRLTRTSFPAEFQAAGHGAANVGFQNDGPNTATNVTWTVTVTGSSDIFLEEGGTGGATCNTTSGANSATIVCTFPSVGSVNDDLINISARMTSTSPITVHATITSDTPDPNPANNDFTFPLVIDYADVAVTKTAPASVQSGTNLTYTITIDASGGGEASTPKTVTLTDTLPASLSFISLTQNSGFAYACTTGQTITCTHSAPTSAASFTLVAHVNATSGSITNTASGSSTLFDPDTTNNSSSATTTVTPAVPTLSEWSLIAFGFALAIGGALLVRR